MPIRFNCEHCDTRIRVPDGSEGKRVRCPKCSNKQRVPGEPRDKSKAKSASTGKPDRDLIDIGAADPKDKSRPKKFQPKPPKFDGNAFMEQLKHMPDEPSVDLDGGDVVTSHGSSIDEASFPPPPPPEPEHEPEPEPTPEPPAAPKARDASDITKAQQPDEPQPDDDEAPDLASHDAEPPSRAADDDDDAHTADDIAALASLSSADRDEAAHQPDADESGAPPEEPADDEPDTAPVADERRVESIPALETKPKAPPTAAPAPISLHDSSLPPDDDDDEPAAPLFADDEPEPAPIIRDDEPPERYVPPPRSPITPSPVMTEPTRVPMFMGLLVVSWLLRFLGAFMLVVTCIAAATDSLGVKPQNLVARILFVLAGLTPALITWAIGEAVSALRHIARNSFRG